MSFCRSYCSHGGRCTLPSGHKQELHDSGYCTWTDAEALTREQADKVLREQEGGADFLDYEQPLADLIESLFPDEEEP